MWILEVIQAAVNTTSVLVFLATFMIVYWITSRPKDVPPGPLRWPLIGNLLSLVGKDTLQLLSNLRRRYGDVCGLYIGRELTVVLNGYDVIKDALIKKGTLFAYRPYHPLDTSTAELVMANGQKWKQNRAFVLQAFRDLCFANKGENLETAIVEELKNFGQLIDSLNGPLFPASYLSGSLANVMFRICHGYPMSYNDEKFQWYLKHVEEGVRIFTNTQIRRKCFPPFLVNLLPGDLVRNEKSMRNVENLKSYFDDVCERNFKEYQEGERSCLTYILLEPDSPVTKDRMWGFLNEVMTAGSETTATTLTWFLLLISLYPEKQKKLREQVLSAIGSEIPSLADRSIIPYAEATVLECLRIGSVVPLSVPHTVAHDITFHGYRIPKESTILPNLASVNFDPVRFPDPMEFKPERFLSENEKTVVNADTIIPFSLGPRSCPGETIARFEMFMFITYLVQKYEIVLASNPKTLSLIGDLGLTHRPRHFEVDFLKREV